MDTTLLEFNIARHISLNEDEKQFFFSLLQPRTFQRKEFVLREGETCTHETFVCKGCLRNFNLTDKGMEHTLMFAMEEWWTSDLFSFLTGTPATINIQAVETSEVLQISRANLQILYEQVPIFNKFFRILLQNAFVANQQRLTEKLSLPAEQQYFNFINRYPQLEQRLSQKLIASYLGITPEFLSMLRRKRTTR